MGIGGALIMPSTLSIITNVFPPRERGRAIGVWAGVAGLGIFLGPVIVGWLLEHFWWGSVFLVNVPVVAVAILAGWPLVPESRDPRATPLDPVGALLSIAALVTLVYGIIEVRVRLREIRVSRQPALRWRVQLSTHHRPFGTHTDTACAATATICHLEETHNGTHRP